MPDLLVRGVSDESKKLLTVRAAQHGNSLQAEAKQILEGAVKPKKRGWIQLLCDAALGAEEDGFVLPERQPARDFELE